MKKTFINGVEFSPPVHIVFDFVKIKENLERFYNAVYQIEDAIIYYRDIEIRNGIIGNPDTSMHVMD